MRLGTVTGEGSCKTDQIAMLFNPEPAAKITKLRWSDIVYGSLHIADELVVKELKLVSAEVEPVDVGRKHFDESRGVEQHGSTAYRQARELPRC